MTPEEIKEAIKRLEKLAKLTQYNDAKTLAFELIELREVQENNGSLAEIYIILGIVYYLQSDYPNALEYYSKSLELNEEIGNKKGIEHCLGNIGVVYSVLSDYPKAIEYHHKSLQINEEICNKEGIAISLGNLGAEFELLSDYSKALEYYSKALEMSEELNRKNGIAINLVNIGNIYGTLSIHHKALEYQKKALQINEEIGNRFGSANVMGNIGNTYLNLSDYPNAIEFLTKSVQIDEEIGNKFGVSRNLSNLGKLQNNLLNFTDALEYYKKALQINQEIGDIENMTTNIFNIGKVYSTKESTFFDTKLAEEYLQKSLKNALDLGSKQLVKDIYEQFHTLRYHQKNFEEALMYQTKAITLEREIQSDTISKQSLQFDQRRKIEEDERVRQLKLARFQEQERIFHNILPIAIANRLIEGEQTIAESYENVSIFFSDIVGFTTLSSRIEPDELVKGLNTIFTAFDRIGTKYGLEKIKTIGDAYMAVCGVPESFLDHASRAAKFALEANEVLQTLELSDDFKNLQFRIGLHCGSVVAGIIGEKKFAYDVWGDAVNVASRMESNSETGRIHISEEFAKSIEQNPEFSIIPRGEINIKGKGKMNTYWLEKAK